MQLLFAVHTVPGNVCRRAWLGHCNALTSCAACVLCGVLQVLCSVSDQRAALSEVLRVLRPGTLAAAHLDSWTDQVLWRST
jgi:hypothetical protein